MTDTLHRILPQVQKPARYVGGEYNQIVKDKKNVDVRVAFCFPDTYEIGMSNIGMRILYGLMNEMPGVWCERVFAPWGDMEEQMRAHAIPLYALESHDPVKAFDLIAFTIGYEMSYTNILNMLELSCVPLLAREREGLENIVFSGGESRAAGRLHRLFFDRRGRGDHKGNHRLLPAGEKGWLYEAGISPAREQNRRRVCAIFL